MMPTLSIDAKTFYIAEFEFSCYELLMDQDLI